MASRSAPSVLATGAKRCTASASASSSTGSKATRCFSTSPRYQKTTKLRLAMYDWFERPVGGEKFRDAPEQPTYLGPYRDQPFPMNPHFRSQPVLDQSMREEIFKRVKREKHSLKSVSAELGVDVRRVAAVVRMMTIEKQWKTEGKKMATPYANAVLKMLPKTYYDPREQITPHEPVNEVHIHKLTMQQLFVPTSESRHFTREDAAESFHRNMLSPDKRSPHAQLIELQRATHAGEDKLQSLKKFREETKAEEDALIKAEADRQKAEEARTTRVDTGRFEFRFKDVNIDAAGKYGRGRNGVGWRYGVPFDDRKKGKLKIPTSVP